MTGAATTFTAAASESELLSESLDMPAKADVWVAEEERQVKQ